MQKLSQNQAFRLISIVVASAVGCILFILLFGVFDYNEFFNMQQDGPTLQGQLQKEFKNRTSNSRTVFSNKHGIYK